MRQYIILLLFVVEARAIDAQPGGHPPKLQSIVILTDDQDSLVRSYSRQGFTVEPLERDPVRLFRDVIVLPNKTSIVFESPRVQPSWRHEALASFGRAFVSELRFHTSHPDSLRLVIESQGIGVVLLDSAMPSLGFSLDSTSPLVLTFSNDSTIGIGPKHERGYYRIDWLILGASNDSEERLRRLFDAVGFRKFHQGCCDFWRTGPASDPTFVRFEMPQAPWRGETQWLSIGKNALYFAYH